MRHGAASFHRRCGYDHLEEGGFTRAMAGAYMHSLCIFRFCQLFVNTAAAFLLGAAAAAPAADLLVAVTTQPFFPNQYSAATKCDVMCFLSQFVLFVLRAHL